MKYDTPIYLAGHRGLVGSAVLRHLQAAGYTTILTRTHNELDLTRQADVETFFYAEQPEVVIFAAAWKSGVKKLINLGSSCIYPKYAP